MVHESAHVCYSVLFPICCRYVLEVPEADSDNIVRDETTTIFLISIYQYIGLVVALSTAAPFRKSFLTNCKYCTSYSVLKWLVNLHMPLPLSPFSFMHTHGFTCKDWFVLCLLLLFPANLYLTLAPYSWWPWFWDRTQLKPNSHIYFKVGLVLLALVHCVLAYFLEV